jgi:RNA-binding protein
MGELNGAQRKHLRGVAHGYKPLVQIGKDGLTDNVLGSIDDAIAANELIKVKMTAERDEREQLIPIIEERLPCECVGAIGRIAILYRQSSDPEKRKITFP